MDYRLTDHAMDDMRRRELPMMLLDAILKHPQQIVPEEKERRAYESLIDLGGGKQAVFHAIAEESETLVVVTVYYTTNVEKYWETHESDV